MHAHPWGGACSGWGGYQGGCVSYTFMSQPATLRTRRGHEGASLSSPGRRSPGGGSPAPSGPRSALTTHFPASTSQMLGFPLARSTLGRGARPAAAPWSLGSRLARVTHWAAAPHWLHSGGWGPWSWPHVAEAMGDYSVPRLTAPGRCGKAKGLLKRRGWFQMRPQPRSALEQRQALSRAVFVS